MPHAIFPARIATVRLLRAAARLRRWMSRRSPDALHELAVNTDLRHRMAEAGVQRAESIYDWRHVIPAYETVWEELAGRRAAGTESAAKSQHRAAHPLRPDPYRMFAGFPTEHLSLQDRIEIAAKSVEEINQLIRHRMNMFTPDILLSADDIAKLVNAVGRRPGAALGELVPDLAEDDPPRLLRTAAWMVKLGFLRASCAGTGTLGGVTPSPRHRAAAPCRISPVSARNSI